MSSKPQSVGETRPESIQAQSLSDVGLFSGFLAVFKRDLTLAYRNQGELFNPLTFFLIVITMVPLGITPDPEVLAELAPGMIWVVALLATLLSLDGLFRSDFEDGSLEQLLISPSPLYLLVLGKVAVHWLVTGLPLTLLAPLLGVMLFLPDSGYGPLVLSLFLGTASLSLIGSIGAALTVGLRKGGLLLSLIIMPLYSPILIFGASSVASTIDGFGYTSQIAVLGAFLSIALICAPFAAAGALRVSVNG